MTYTISLESNRPVITKTEIYGAKHVAVLDVHNVAGDFMAPFQTLITEAPLNASPTGIVFFRWHRPNTRENETRESAQLRYFQALHETVGLDAVVVFGGNGYTQTCQGVEIASGVRKIDPQIKIYLQTYDIDNEVDKFYENELELFDLIDSQRPLRSDDAVILLTSLVGLPIQTTTAIRDAQNKNWNTSAILDFYEQKYPNIRKPEKFAAHVPSRPDPNVPGISAPGHAVG